MVYRILALYVIFVGALWACTGDCKACHQNLDFQNDIRHRPMTECKTCHTDAKMAQIDMGGCGKDCFACHDIQKVQAQALAKEHYVINACIQCHSQLSTSPINTGEGVFQKSLKNFSDGLMPTLPTLEGLK
ncbi:hypothetical protein LS71_000765 [Helicobacter jaachi]|uniref:Uncharacterized protein n=1 Tax=Helicobacter jaachi TaxID=1677920 RepID=A0A4U8TBN5_9HELI|nr:hypothetical protein [Helicobacter jaachi]TLD97321.1 hypothetical protein LS71_000765 [Helicobacter jaachi]